MSTKKNSKESTVRVRPIDIAHGLAKRQTVVLGVCIAVPPILIIFVLIALTMFQDALYGPGKQWYKDPFTDIMIFLFLLGQVFAFVQFIKYQINVRKIVKLLRVISGGKELESLDDLQGLAEQIRNFVPHSSERLLVLNWLDYSGASTMKRNENLENTAYIRMDLLKEK